MSDRQEIRNMMLLASLMKSNHSISKTNYSLLKDLIFKRDKQLCQNLNLRNDNLNSSFDFSDLEYYAKQSIDIYSKQLISDLFAEFPLEEAHIIASVSIDELSEQEGKSLVYGEVDFDCFVETLKIATQGLDCNKFVDLGHGSGRAIFITGVICDFEVLTGIEILSGLYKVSQDLSAKFNSNISPKLMHKPHFDLHHGSFLEDHCIWTDADLVFANSTCFEQSLLEDVAQCARHMRIGSRLITFTVPLPSYYFQIIFKKRMTMSWGPATVYIHQRIFVEDENESPTTPNNNKNNYNTINITASESVEVCGMSSPVRTGGSSNVNSSSGIGSGSSSRRQNKPLPSKYWDDRYEDAREDSQLLQRRVRQDTEQGIQSVCKEEEGNDRNNSNSDSNSSGVGNGNGSNSNSNSIHVSSPSKIIVHDIDSYVNSFTDYSSDVANTRDEYDE